MHGALDPDAGLQSQLLQGRGHEEARPVSAYELAGKDQRRYREGEKSSGAESPAAGATPHSKHGSFLSETETPGKTSYLETLLMTK